MATNHPSQACSRAAFRLGFRALRLSCVCLGLAVASAASLLGQDAGAVHPDSSGIVGHLAAHDTHEPIGSARVTLANTALATSTDSSGQFVFSDLDSGVVVIEIRAVGYAPGTWRACLTPHHVLHFADFERRRQSGMGAFLTQEHIERANTASLVDVLVTVRGVQQICLANQCVAKMVRSPPGCYPQYFLDGRESSAYFARLTPPQDVKGVEIYRGSSETPGEFQGSNSGCGVIVIWTKSSP
ncbi:MAG: hypothetical protein DMD60_05890 [Gemmatimonadetes bacterium]|nr:MAG: hypothetical protein DMD60_05890 [Gemmatimonadota bacterium]